MQEKYRLFSLLRGLFEKLFFISLFKKKKCNENSNIYFSTKLSILFVKYDNKEKLMTSNGTPQF